MSQAIDDLIHQRLGFGCGRLKGGSDRKRSFDLIGTALLHGVRHFDVAPLYGMGAAEEVLGQALASTKVPVTVATKVGIPRPQPSSLWKLARRIAKPIASVIPGVKTAALKATAPKERTTCFAPDFMLASFQDSLSRLKVNEIEVLFLHEPDPALEMARIRDVLAPLVESGQVRHLGSSTGAPLAQLVPFGTAAQYRYDLASETINSATAWDAQHGALRFLAPHLANVISSSPWIKRRVQDIVPGGNVDAAIGALSIAYVLQRCNTRLVVSSDSPVRLGSTLTTMRSLLGLSEWLVTVELMVEAMHSGGAVR